MRRRRTAALLVASAAVAVAAVAVAAPPSANARIDAATSIAGPDGAIVALDDVAMAEDGTGGVVYRRFEDGSTHVFAARYDGHRWHPPQRVDVGQRHTSAWPRIAAAAGGLLAVTWTQDGPPGQDSLHSAVLPRGSNRFLAPTTIDWTVGEALATYPSIAMAPGGAALLAYRVVSSFLNPDLPPGYVRGEIRLARFDGWRWSKLGRPVDRNQLAPKRGPTEANSPKVAIASDGSGVVAWQEPDDQLIDRVWARRIFDTRTGVVLQASPSEQGGRAVGGHADAFDVAATDYGRAIVALRQQSDPRDRTAPPRIYVNEMPEATDEQAHRFLATGPQLADGAGARAPAAPGAPSVALGDRVALLVGFPRGDSTVLASGEGDRVGDVLPTGGLAAVPPAIDAGVAGRGTVAYASGEGGGRVIVQQLAGARPVRTQAVSGPVGGPVRSIAVAGSGTGDALVAFAQGESDEGQIAVARVDAPPVPFAVVPPSDWTKARRPLLVWDPPPAGFRPRAYTVEVDGRRVARTRGVRYRFREGALRDGRHKVRVIATNRVGETETTRPAALWTDRRPPGIRLSRKRGAVVVTIRDGRRRRVSGPARGSSRIAWGDGASTPAVGRRARHRYRRPGRYRITARMMDNAGNRAVQRLWVRAR